MSNKYNSNMRNFTARNLVWNHAATQGVIPAGLFTVSPPSSISINNSAAPTAPDLVTQFFDSNDPYAAGGTTREGWDPSSNLMLRRVGLFSNFADGLVLENLEGRIGLVINTCLMKITKVAGSTITFTAGSNLVSGTNFNTAFPSGYEMISRASAISGLFSTHDLYTLYKLTDTTARLSNYALATSTDFVYKVNPAVVGTNAVTTISIMNLPTLNALYETERFFIAANKITGQNPFIYGQLVLDTLDGKFDFLTKAISTSFVGTPVTFDAVIEVEVTQNT